MKWEQSGRHGENFGRAAHKICSTNRSEGELTLPNGHTIPIDDTQFFQTLLGGDQLTVARVKGTVGQGALIQEASLDAIGLIGCNIPCNLHMEHLNRLKTILRALGTNITPATVVKAGQALATVHKVCQVFEAETSPFSSKFRYSQLTINRWTLPIIMDENVLQAQEQSLLFIQIWFNAIIQRERIRSKQLLMDS